MSKQTDEGRGAVAGQVDRPVRPDPERAEVSPEFTDTARAALLWVLWHHQGGSSPIGQPIRFALGMGEHQSLSEQQVLEAKRWAELTKSSTRDFHGGRRFAGWFAELRSGMSYRLWEQGGHEPGDGEVALYEA